MSGNCTKHACLLLNDVIAHARFYVAFYGKLKVCGMLIFARINFGDFCQFAKFAKIKCT
jgi:hypothetical protein